MSGITEVKANNKIPAFALRRNVRGNYCVRVLNGIRQRFRRIVQRSQPFATKCCSTVGRFARSSLLRSKIQKNRPLKFDHGRTGVPPAR